MKALIVTLSTLFLIVRDTIGQDDGYSLYSRRYERLNIDIILASPRLVTNYVDCLLSKKPCPPEGKSLKRILPEALRTKCGRCWPSQKEGALKVITALYNDYPQHYQALRERWDPTGEYHRRFEEYLRDQKFNNINSNGGQENADQGDTSQVTLTQLTDNNIRSNFVPRTRQVSTSFQSSSDVSNSPNLITSNNDSNGIPNPSLIPKQNSTVTSNQNNIQRITTKTTTGTKRTKLTTSTKKGTKKSSTNNKNSSSITTTTTPTTSIPSASTPITYFSQNTAPRHQISPPPFEYNMSTILQDIMRAIFRPLRSFFIGQ